ncbi:MAG: DUF4339 domain-containing protein [Planctomycetaceae bacterium]
MSQWYVQSGGKTIGPLSAAQLKQLADSERIDTSTKVRQGEAGKWLDAGKVKGLFTNPDESSSPERRSEVPESAVREKSFTEYSALIGSWLGCLTLIAFLTVGVQLTKATNAKLPIGIALLVGTPLGIAMTLNFRKEYRLQFNDDTRVLTITSRLFSLPVYFQRVPLRETSYLDTTGKDDLDERLSVDLLVLDTNDQGHSVLIHRSQSRPDCERLAKRLSEELGISLGRLKDTKQNAVRKAPTLHFADFARLRLEIRRVDNKQYLVIVPLGKPAPPESYYLLNKPQKLLATSYHVSNPRFMELGKTPYIHMPSLFGFDRTGRSALDEFVEFETNDELEEAITFLCSHQKITIQWKQLDPIFDDTSNPPWERKM